jgi:hypothetical protein
MSRLNNKATGERAVLPSLSKEEAGAVLDLVELCAKSTQAIAKILFPHLFYRPFCSVHHTIFEMLDRPGRQKRAVAAPRGIGKTSTIGIAYPAKKILFQEKKFIVYVSSTATHAVMQTENLKQELITNEMIVKLFGPQKTIAADESFAKNMWVTSGGTLVLPRGAGQQIRGLNYRGARPDLIIIDDLEDDEDEGYYLVVPRGPLRAVARQFRDWVRNQSSAAPLAFRQRDAG